jgi:phosphatidylserine/phosphatidylglycerophosphate/cardiolipin synthase-like enzyme
VTASNPETPRAHEDVVVELLENVADGAHVHASLWDLSLGRPMGAFKHAAEVGTLHLVSDASATHWRMRAVREAAAESYVEVFQGTNHNKFVLVDNLATGEEWVVYTTSGNFTRHQRLWEQMTVVHMGNRGLYDSYLEYWESLRAGKPVSLERRHGRAKLWTYPTDNGHAFLEGITAARCDRGAAITISSAQFRSTEVAWALRRASQEGCLVSVRTAEHWADAGDIWILTNNTDVTLTYADTHSKWMAIDKVGKRSNAYVYTGSANINERVHEAADSTIRLKGRAIYDAFWSQG